jgi:membrane-associated phospholipid phosphatase
MLVLNVPLLSIWQGLMNLDHWLFRLINEEGSSHFLDIILPFLREAQFWMPFYLFLLVFATLNFGYKGWWWALAFVLTAALCDLVSSQLIKENIFRLRPCRDPLMLQEIIVRAKYCPKSSSFTSSHATTHFGLSMFLFQTFKNLSKWWAVIFVWPLVICYTQVYVGVHYPLDVLAGGITGCIIGIMMAYIFTKQIGLINFGNQHRVQ